VPSSSLPRSSFLVDGLRAAAFGLCVLVAACGGSDDSTAPSTPTTPVTPTDPGTPAAPTASFTSANSAAVNQTVVFDASASTSPDGSALTYVWDFGDGLRGGGKTIARSFGAGGARTVTLTVIDGGARSGSASRTLTVTAPSTGPAITVNGKITGTDGSPLSGVSVTWVGASSSTPGVSDAAGKVSLALPRGTPVTLKLTKTGFADQFVQLNLPASTGADAYFEAIQRTRDAALTLADAAAGGTLTGRDGAGITLPPNAFVDSTGATVTGAIQISVTPVDATQSGGGGFPGQFDGIHADGKTTPIVSFGAVEYIPTSGAGRLQLAPGKTASIDVPIYGAMRPDGTTLAIGDAVPLWSLDETTSMWIQEGTGQVVASASSPSGLAMRATVSHLTWWNADLGFDPYGPGPNCVAAGDIGIPGAIDSFAAATVCNMLAEIDRNLSGASAPRVHALAETTNPRIAGYSRRVALMIGNGATLPVPANLNILLTASALNGTWTGSKVVRGPVGLQEPVNIEMRPVGTSGATPEAVTPPFDANRSLQDGQTARFTFTGTRSQFARITVSSRDLQSNLFGRVRLLQGTTEMGSANFNTGINAEITAALPTNATYTVEVTGTANMPGGYHIKIETPGSVQTESLAYPFAVTKSLPALTRYRGSFTSTGVAAYFGLRSDYGGSLTNLRIFGADGSLVADSGATAAGVLAQTVMSLPAGGYTAEIVRADGTATLSNGVNITGEPTSWVPVAEIAPITGNTYRGMIDLIADRNGRPVIGYWDLDLSAQTRTAFLRLRRWTGSAWENVGTDLSVALGNGYCSSQLYVTTPRPRMASFTFDSSNNPVIVYRVEQETSFPNSLSATTVRSFVNGSWQAVGPNGGNLPLTANNGEYCDDVPMIGMSAANQPVVAYRTTGGVSVQRYDGAAWKGLTNAAADTFTDSGNQNGDFVLGFDASRQPYLALAGVNTVVVRRFNAQSATWETVGPNNGTVADFGSPNAQYYGAGRFAFNASGAPTLALFANYGGGRGPVVFRYTGSAWTTSFYPRAANQTAIPFSDAVAITPSGSDLLVSWHQGIDSDWYSPVVQRSTASGWSPIGGGMGEVPQFAKRGIANPQILVTSPLLLQNSDGTYLATLLRQSSVLGADGYRLILSRKVAD
jgi:hypothetical protein